MTTRPNDAHSIVLGVGRDKSLSDVVRLALEELSRSDGPPRRLTATAPGMQLVAERDSLDHEFQDFFLQTSLSPVAHEAVEKFVAEHGQTCSLESHGEQHEIRIRATAGTDAELHTVLQALSDVVDLPETWRVRGDGHHDQHVSPDSLFQTLEETKASDLHLFPGSPPVVRVNGSLQTVESFEPLSAHQIFNLIREIAPAETWDRFQKEKQCSFRYHQVGRAYSRVSAFVRGFAPHCTLRYLPEDKPSFEELMLPAGKMQSLAELHDGLVLVTGMTGSGKSSTVAALVDWINGHKSQHILTIEDPIEFIHQNRKSIVSQREAGADFVSFTEAIRGALRQDPDVIFVGEMRDADTIRAVIDAAATGHLVISTLHAATAAEAADRIVSFFEPNERDLVRHQLHECLRCIMCQRLVPRIAGSFVPNDELDDVEYLDESDVSETEVTHGNSEGETEDTADDAQGAAADDAAADAGGEAADETPESTATGYATTSEPDQPADPFTSDVNDVSEPDDAGDAASEDEAADVPVTQAVIGRVPALEFLFNDTKQISDCLLNGDTRGIRVGMQQTFSESSIFEESLLKLFKAGLITEEDASAYAPHPESLEQMKLGTYRPPSLESMVHEY